MGEELALETALGDTAVALALAHGDGDAEKDALAVELEHTDSVDE